MEPIEKSIEVHVPVRTAYNQWTQFEEFPQFMQGVREVQQLDERHVHWVAEVGGRRKEWDAEISEQIPDKRIAWHSVGGTKNDGVVEFDPVSQDDTRITIHMEYEPEGLVENLADFFGTTSRRVEGDLERFKSFVESRGRETGAWRGQIEQNSQPGAAETSSSSVAHGDKTSGQRLAEGEGPRSATASPYDDAAYRADFNQRYGAMGSRYEEYEPAYRYGCDLRSTHSAGSWSDVEAGARRDWERDRPGTWERFKEAIRTGWDKVVH